MLSEVRGGLPWHRRSEGTDDLHAVVLQRVLVNRGGTPYDGVATLRVWAGIGEVLPPAVARARQILGE